MAVGRASRALRRHAGAVRFPYNEFTSQLYFPDALTDTVHAQQPYAARGARNARNANDGIFRNGGEQLMLAPTRDGAGYAATFHIALQV